MANSRDGLGVSGSGNGADAVETKALAGAMDLFWAQGAEVASYNDLVAATGLSRKALYRRWPEKGALIADTLRVYRTQMVSQLTDLLRQGGRKGLEDFIQALSAAAQDEGWAGCYLFRTASGPLRSQSFVTEVFYDYIDELEKLLKDCIIDGQKAGDIDAAIRADLAANQMIGLISLMSAIGGQTGYGPRVAALIVAARLSCGLEVKRKSVAGSGQGSRL